LLILRNHSQWKIVQSHGILTTYPWYIDPPTHGISVFTTNFDRGRF
jgi:hypothetical protein